MNRQERAKQFMPFDALKGLQEELRKKEIEYEERKEICDTSLEELENEFNKIQIGYKIKVKYYKKGQYVNITGILKKINYQKKKIQIDNEIINLCDIIKIEI